jgi:hypothetical protein
MDEQSRWSMDDPREILGGMRRDFSGFDVLLQAQRQAKSETRVKRDWNLSRIAHTPFVPSLRQAQARVCFAYRSANGSQGRNLEQFALRYLRANGES